MKTWRKSRKSVRKYLGDDARSAPNSLRWVPVVLGCQNWSKFHWETSLLDMDAVFRPNIRTHFRPTEYNELLMH